MNAANDAEALIRRRIAMHAEQAPGSLGDLLHFQLTECNPESGEYLFTCRTESWMRNLSGTLHGGMCAAILDQAMSIVANCLKAGEGSTPTLQLKVDYHRPLFPGESVLVKVCAVSVSGRHTYLNAEASRLKVPGKICISGSGIHYYKKEE